MYPNMENMFLKGPFYFGENIVYRLLERHDEKKKTQIIMTSPNVVLSTYCNTRRYLMVNIDHLKSTKSCVSLYQYIIKLEKYLKNNKAFSDQRQLLSVIHNWNGNKYLRFSLSAENINIYDADKNLINIDEIKKGSLIKIMFWLKGLVVNRETFSLQLEILQIRMFDVIPPKQCLITLDELAADITKAHDANRSEKNPGTHVIPEKYQKMLNMGIPISHVKQKCILDGVDPEILTGKKTEETTSKTKPININRGLPNLLGEISNFKLKKTTPIDRQKQKIKTKTPDNMLIPSLEDILHIKSQLRKISQ